MAEIKLTKDNFETEVMQATLPVLIDFWAPWCGPCRMLAPAIEEIAEEYAGKIKVGKVNVDDEMELANAFHVSAIPTVVVMKDGKPVNVSQGLRPKEDIIEMFAKLI